MVDLDEVWSCFVFVRYWEEDCFMINEVYISGWGFVDWVICELWCFDICEWEGYLLNFGDIYGGKEEIIEDCWGGEKDW